MDHGSIGRRPIIGGFSPRAKLPKSPWAKNNVMSFLNLIRIALKALQRNKLRAFLTMLGIIIGVGSVIAMVAIGQGSKQSIHDSLSNMGSNMITVSPASNLNGGVKISGSSF